MRWIGGRWADEGGGGVNRTMGNCSGLIKPPSCISASLPSPPANSVLNEWYQRRRRRQHCCWLVIYDSKPLPFNFYNNTPFLSIFSVCVRVSMQRGKNGRAINDALNTIANTNHQPASQPYSTRFMIHNASLDCLFAFILYLKKMIERTSAHTHTP